MNSETRIYEVICFATVGCLKCQQIQMLGCEASNEELKKTKQLAAQPRKGLNRAGTELWNSQAFGQC